MRRPYVYTPEIHDRIAAAREAMDGMSQSRMSLQMGYSQGYFGKVESDRSYKIVEHMVVSICNAFGIRYDYLVFGEEPIFEDDEETRQMVAYYRQLPRAEKLCTLRFAKFLVQERQGKQ